MSRIIEWPAVDTLPSREAALALQGISAADELPAHIEALVDDAMAMYCGLAVPRAVVADIETDAFAAVYSGDGRNSIDTPVAAIFPKADRLALMAATIGAALPERVRSLFRDRDVALGCMLDSVGSAAADRLAELVAERYLSMIGSHAGVERRALVYSPGYCGWHVSGQRALFRFLEPEQIGITLNTSCLMQPLKSVSGVLVVGRPEVHRFRPRYEFCDTCRDKPCRLRMAAVAIR